MPRLTAFNVEKSIAVLPFENLSADKQNAYFADGIQDDILTNLSKIRDLKVISRTSVMGYRGVRPARGRSARPWASARSWKEVCAGRAIACA